MVVKRERVTPQNIREGDWVEYEYEGHPAAGAVYIRGMDTIYVGGASIGEGDGEDGFYPEVDKVTRIVPPPVDGLYAARLADDEVCKVQIVDGTVSSAWRFSLANPLTCWVTDVSVEDVQDGKCAGRDVKWTLIP